jgi:hypothetical protein
MAKKLFTTGVATIGAVEHDITNLKFGRTQDKKDDTDTGSPAGIREYLQGRTDSVFSFDMFLDEAVAPPIFGVAGDVTLDFEGMVVSGSGVIESQDLNGQLDEPMSISCSGYFTTVPTITPVT